MKTTNMKLRLLGAAAALGLAGCGDDGVKHVVLPMPTIPQHTPKAALEAVRDSFAKGNPAALWAALPASYQDDVNFLVRDFAGKMDPQVYDEGIQLIGRMARVFKDKRDYMTGNPMFSNMVPGNGAATEAGWECAVDMFSVLTGSEVATVDGLRTFDGGEFLRGTGATMMQLFDRVVHEQGHSLAELGDATVTLVRDEHEHPVLRLSIEGESDQNLVFTQVDGKWVPLELTTRWDEAISQAKAGLAEMPDMNTDAAMKMQSQMALGMIRGIVEQLETAGSREEFEQALFGMGGMMGAAGAPR